MGNLRPASKLGGVQRRKSSKSQKAWNDGREIVSETTGVLWKPHKTNHYLIVAAKKHYSPSGLLIHPGYQVRFSSPENRDKWLASQYPKRHGKRGRGI